MGQLRFSRDARQVLPRPDIGDDARVLIVDRWMAIYRLVPGGAQIVRIVDGARDLLRFPSKSPDIE